MYIFIFVCIILAGAIGCKLVGLGHERGNGMLITVGMALLFIAIIALAFHP